MTVPRQRPRGALEKEHVWTSRWVCVGVEQQIPHPGDLLPATVGDYGLHVQRQPDGTLRAAFNILQYGSCWTIPAQCGNGHKTRCPYVSCGHSLDTDALPAEDGVPTREMRQFIGFNPLKLLPVSLARLGPLLFVCLDVAEAPALREQLGTTASDVQQSGLDKLEYGGRFWTELDCHWTLAEDALVGAIDRPDCANRLEQPDAAGRLLVPPSLATLRVSDGKTPDTAQVCHGLPNVVLVLLRSHVAVIVIKPIRLDGVAIVVHLYVSPGILQAPHGEDAILGLVDIWKRVCEQARVGSAHLQRASFTRF